MMHKNDRLNYPLNALAKCINLRYGLICSVTLVSLTGCSALNSIVETDRVDYKSASKAPSLEVPPDLTQLQRDNRYAIPEIGKGVATASTLNLQQNAAPAQGNVVAPAALGDLRIERAGNQRWLVIKRSPEDLWPQIKDFWLGLGFVLNVDAPQAGVMETDWAENRAKIPQDMIRRTIGKVFDSIYSTGERDKFRTRLERRADGSTEIYISHRGVEEILVGKSKETTMWTNRPSDPELEADFLSRLMVRLGATSDTAKAVLTNQAIQPSLAKLVQGSGTTYIEVNEEFDRAWRRVGLALDRAGFTVEDRDRNSGIYFVRYLNQEEGQTTEEKGFFSKLLSFGNSDKNEKAAQRYRIQIKSANAGSQVNILNADGAPDSTPIGNKILTQLTEQLK